METRRCIVEGRVQGVGFRYFVIRNARRLGVRGTVRNRVDGSVEAVLQADSLEPIEQLIELIHEGPSSSRVDRVDIEPVEENPPLDEMGVLW